MYWVADISKENEISAEYARLIQRAKIQVAEK